jgi:hypothetical protein
MGPKIRGEVSFDELVLEAGGVASEMPARCNGLQSTAAVLAINAPSGSD